MIVILAAGKGVRMQSAMPKVLHGVGGRSMLAQVLDVARSAGAARLALVVAPRNTASIKSVKDLAGKKVGVTAPGSSTDFFLKFLLSKNGVDPNSIAVIGVGIAATAVAAMEQGSVDATVMLDPAITLLQGKNKDLRILSDTRTQKDTLEVFGGEYPGGALYTNSDWIASHPKETQALTNAIVATLKWIHSHTPEEIMAKMPDNLVGPDKALYLAALKNTIPMYSQTGRMDPKGAAAVLVADQIRALRIPVRQDEAVAMLAVNNMQVTCGPVSMAVNDSRITMLAQHRLDSRQVHIHDGHLFCFFGQFAMLSCLLDYPGALGPRFGEKFLLPGKISNRGAEFLIVQVVRAECVAMHEQCRLAVQIDQAWIVQQGHATFPGKACTN